MGKYILAIDEGTTSVRASLFNLNFKIIDSCNKNIKVNYGEDGSVEQSFEEIFDHAVHCCRNVVEKTGIDPKEILTVAISAQRGTWCLWDKTTGKTLSPAVVWQDSRASARKRFTEMKADEGFKARFPETSSFTAPFHPLSTFPSLVEADSTLVEKAKGENVTYGTVDAWLIFKLTGGKSHATAASMASTCGMAKNSKLGWDLDLFDFIGINSSGLPEIKNEADDYGMMTADILGVEIPICGVGADQQAALFSHGCHEKNTAKCTSGTGSFLTVNVGKEWMKPTGGYNVRVAWKIGEESHYMIEGFSSTTGAALEWAKNNMELFDSFDELEEKITEIKDSGGVYFFPALTGHVSPPFFNGGSRASFMGISAGTKKEHFLRAVVESVPFSICALFKDLENKFQLNLKTIMVSGGVSKSDHINQMVANLIEVEVNRSACLEASSLGVVQFAAIHIGKCTIADVKNNIPDGKIYTPDKDNEESKKHFVFWEKAAARSLDWV